jgi:hypothetical protein
LWYVPTKNCEGNYVNILSERDIIIRFEHIYDTTPKNHEQDYIENGKKLFELLYGHIPSGVHKGFVTHAQRMDYCCSNCSKRFKCWTDSQDHPPSLKPYIGIDNQKELKIYAKYLR